MDTSETNIKMCEKAEEIQELAPEKWQDYRKPRFGLSPILNHDADFVSVKMRKEHASFAVSKHKIGDTWWGLNNNEKGYQYSTFSIWLPRQCQLQILSGLSWQEFDKECLKYDVETKEQAGLQVVMKSRYSKVWDGSNWTRKTRD